MRENPERFIESNTENSWMQYLTNMAMQGTWCDGLIIQAVADSLNLQIYIVESNENFAESTIINPVNSQHGQRTICLGHEDEVHYVSTVPCTDSDSLQTPCSGVPLQDEEANARRKHNLHQREYQAKRKRSDEEKLKQNAYKKEYRQERKNTETSSGTESNKRQKHNSYMREYRQKKKNAESISGTESTYRQKHNSYMREYKQKKKITESNSGTESNKRQKHNSYMREYRQKKKNTENNSGTKSNYQQKRNSYMRDYRKTKHCASVDDLVASFHDIVSKGPLYICSCCDQLWYKHSVLPAAQLRELNGNNVGKFLLNRMSVNNLEWLCKACHSYLVKERVPPCSAVNGMQFTTKPCFFDLNELECRLLAPRLAFQKLMQAPRGKQFKINGNIVNVPADVTNTVSMLPRFPDQSGTIKINLKRKLQYKSSALSLNVRPHKVIQASQLACQ